MLWYNVTNLSKGRLQMTQKLPPRKQRGIHALRSAAQALHYEWNTAHTSLVLMSLAKRNSDQVLMNASLESFLIHARNICDFFDVRGRQDDILAKDFLGRTPRARLTYIRKNKVRIHKRIAHLSYSRPRLKRGWASALMMKEIDGAMRVFIGRLKQKYRLIARRVFGV